MQFRPEPQNQYGETLSTDPRPDTEALFHSDLQRRGKTLLRRCGVPGPDVEDVLQDGNLAALIQLRKGNYKRTSADSLTFWFRAILRRKACDYWREREVRGRVERLFMELTVASCPEGDQKLEDAVREALARLPDRHRKILMLNRWEGYKIHEIATILKRSPGRVGAILANSKHLLAQALADQHIVGRGTRGSPDHDTADKQLDVDVRESFAQTVRVRLAEQKQPGASAPHDFSLPISEQPGYLVTKNEKPDRVEASSPGMSRASF